MHDSDLSKAQTEEDSYDNSAQLFNSKFFTLFDKIIFLDWKD